MRALVTLFMLLLLTACHEPKVETVEGIESNTTQQSGVAIEPIDTSEYNRSSSDSLLEVISDEEWDSLAVRKVLHTFAYGGHATDMQIERWADMSPKSAIEEMLTLNPQNALLSPPQNDENLSTLKTVTDVGNFMYAKRDDSIYFKVSWATPTDSSLWRNWGASVLLRGLNPFASKIGLWETNYHMSANQEVIFYSNIMYAYYEDIMAEHQKGSSYDRVMARASWSHAISKQYGFTNTRYHQNSDRFSLLNEDFAREFHQLFFCNLGEYNPTYHEETTIKNTAKALTGLKNCYADDHFLARCEPDPDHHYSANLEILDREIVGSDISEKMSSLAKVALAHEESLKNLPIYIISSLADDNMNEETKKRIENSWKNLKSKNFLDFIRLYAISTSFHSPDRIKYQSSIDRSVLFWNKLMTDNNALYINGYAYYFLEMNEEGVRPFYLKHNVFGHQTGIESVNSAYSISQMLSNRIKLYDFYCKTVGWKDGEDIYHKRWSSTIPPDDNGGYTKGYVVRWLWNNLIADNLKNYGVLERAHLLALISGKDLGYLLDEENPTRVYSSSELQSEAIESKLKLLEQESIDVDSSAYNINRAMTFIGATPYVFIEEGR